MWIVVIWTVKRLCRQLVTQRCAHRLNAVDLQTIGCIHNLKPLHVQ